MSIVRILRVLKWIAITLVVLVVASVLYLSFADLNWLKPHIESAVSEVTGRQLKIGGELDLDIVPSPTIVLEDVSLSNAKWGTKPMLATIGHVSARLGFWSLLSGPVRIKEFRLRDVNILLEKNKQGEANWVMGHERKAKVAEQPQETAKGHGGVPLIIEFAQLRDIKLSYRAPKAKPLVVSLASLDINTDADQYTVLNGKGVVDDLSLRMAGKLGPQQALAKGNGIGINLKTSLGNVDLDVDGTVGDLAARSGINLKAVMSSNDVARILKHFAVKLPLEGAMHVKAAVTSVEPGTRVTVDAKVGEIAATATAIQHADEVSFKVAVHALDKVGKTLKIQGLPAQDLTVDGRIKSAPKTYMLQGIIARCGTAEFKLDGKVGQDMNTADFIINASGPSLASLSAGLPGIPFTAALTASVAPEHLVFDDIKAVFGKSDLAGSLIVVMTKKTAIAGKFKSKRLDLTPFVGEPVATSKGEKQKKQKAAPQPAKTGSKRKYVFVDEPLPLAKLKKIDMKIGTDIGRLTLHRVVLLDVTTAVDLKNGNLKLKNRFRGAEGGKGISDIALSAAGKSTNLDMKVNMRDLRLNLISGDVKDASLIPPIGITLDVKSSGGSPHALASSANGRVLLTQGKGRIENDILSSVSGDILAQLFSALNPFAKKEKTTGLDCTIVGLNISKGKANIAGLLFQTEKVTAVGDGDIDLKTEALNIEFNTEPRSGVGLSADMFVKPFVMLAGTLASPNIGLNKKGVLFAGVAVATGGMSVWAKGAFDRARGQVDQCTKVLKEVGGHPPIKD